MILTVTLNTALDRVLFIDEWTPGLPMRASRVVTSVGGKGLDSSVALRQLGVETVGLCFLAGDTGAELLRAVEAYGIQAEPVWVEGETRLASVIAEQRWHRHSHILSGQLVVRPEHCRQLLEGFARFVQQAEAVICGGAFPPGVPAGFFGQLTEIAHQAGMAVLIDSRLEVICAALPARPDVVKMNWDEFERTFEVKAVDLPALIRAGAQVRRQRELRALVVTCAGQGILAYTSEGAYHALAPLQPAVNAAGAGDAVSAALAWRLSRGDPWPEALGFAAATGAAAVLTEGTADCRLEDILRIRPEVRVTSLTV